jgi:acetyl-CoA synthetase
MSTAEIESAIVSHPKVAEAAVIGQSDEDTGQSVAAFVTLEGDLEGSDELVAELREHVAQRIGKLARPKRIIWSDDLPKTRSGKIMRAAARHRRGARARGRDHPARPGRDAAAPGAGQRAAGRGVTHSSGT